MVRRSSSSRSDGTATGPRQSASASAAVAGLPAEPLEPQRVDRVGVDGEQVAALHLAHQPGVAERGAQPGHQRLQGVRHVGGRVLAPHRVDQRRRGHRPAGGEREVDQQGAQPPPAHVDGGLPAQDPQRAEQVDGQRPRRHLQSLRHAPMLPLRRTRLLAPTSGAAPAVLLVRSGSRHSGLAACG